MQQQEIVKLVYRFESNLLGLYNKYYQSGNYRLDWYDIARQEISSASEQVGISHNVMAWAVATVSPKMPWRKNIRVAQEILLYILEGNNPTEKTWIAPNLNVNKVYQFWQNGCNVEIKPIGRKVSCFYENLVGNYSVPTIDRHAYNACVNGIRSSDRYSGDISPNKTQFKAAYDAYVNCAKLVDMEVAVFQSVIWQFVEKHHS